MKADRRNGRRELLASTVGGLVATLAVLGMAGCGSDDPKQGRATPGARAVYVTNWGSETITSYATEADGSLRGPVSTQPAGPRGTRPQGSVRSKDGGWLYVSNWGTADVTPFRIERDGRLTPLPPVPGPAPKPDNPSGITLARDGSAIYTANFSHGAEGTISHYSVSEDGRPSGVLTVSSRGRGTTGVAVSPDGRTLIAANSGSGDVSSFRVARDGSLTWVMTLPTGAGAFFAAITPDSGRVLVTNSKADSVSLLRLAPDSRLSLVRTVANPASEPRGVVLNRVGDRAYVANFANGTGPGNITAFAVEPSTLKVLEGPISTGSNGAEGIALSSDGRTLYSANFNKNGAGSVTSFPITADGAVGKPRRRLSTEGRQPDLGSITVPLR